MADQKPNKADLEAVEAARKVLEHIACKEGCFCSGACLPYLQDQLKRFIERSGRLGWLEEFDGPAHSQNRNASNSTNDDKEGQGDG